MNKLSLLVIVLISSAAMWSCSSSEEEGCKSDTASKIYNPNGDSELALLMREVFDQSMDIKTSIQAGELEVPENYITNLKAFHTATATDPEVKVEEYFAFSDALYNKAEALSTKGKDEQVKFYNQLVATCVSCHESFCPGPIVKINKLRIKD